jgi:hypothetical protein
LLSGLAEEGELVEEVICCGDEVVGVVDGLLGLAGGGDLAGDIEVFEFVAAAAHGGERAESWPELGSRCGGDGGVASACGGA